jgi:hypothetical protein
MHATLSTCEQMKCTRETEWESTNMKINSVDLFIASSNLDLNCVNKLILKLGEHSQCERVKECYSGERERKNKLSVLSEATLIIEFSFLLHIIL